MSERVAGDGLPIGGPCDHCGKVKPWLARCSYGDRKVRLCHDDTDDCYRETRYGYYLLRPEAVQEPESPYLRDIWAFDARECAPHAANYLKEVQ